LMGGKGSNCTFRTFEKLFLPIKMIDKAF